ATISKRSMMPRWSRSKAACASRSCRARAWKKSCAKNSLIHSDKAGDAVALELLAQRIGVFLGERTYHRAIEGDRVPKVGADHFRMLIREQRGQLIFQLCQRGLRFLL